MQIIIQLHYQMDLQNTLLKKVRLSKHESLLNKLNVLQIHVVYLLCPYGSDHITCYLSVQVCRAKLVMREALRAHHHAFFRPFKKNVHRQLSYECTPNRENVLGTGITLPGRSEVTLAVTTPCRLQLVQC